VLEETLMIMNPWWSEEYRAPGIERENYLKKIDEELGKSRALFIFGLRRVGKTTIMKQYISKKLESFGRKHILFASLDHPEIENTSIIELLRTFRRMNSLDRKEDVMLFLDEVQHRTGFEREIKAIVDSDPHVWILGSGSSSSVIRHRSAALTGRYRKIQVKPLSFEEFLKFKGKNVDLTQPHLMEAYLEDYLRSGGMPEYVLTKDVQVLINLVEDIIYKDIAGNYGIREPKLLKDLFLLLMERVGKPMTYSKLSRILGVGVDSIRRYIAYFEEIYLIDIVEMFGSPNVRKRAPRKVYVADTGIKVAFSGGRNMGSLAENLSYLMLKERCDVYYYLYERGEVDFICRDSAIEVKYMDEIEDEDLDALKSLRLRGIKNKILITRREKDVQGVKTTPLWKLSLNGSQSL